MRSFVSIKLSWLIAAVCTWVNKKAMLSQENCSFRLKFAANIHYKFKSSQTSKARLQSSKHTGIKQNLTQNGDSRSFKVMYFGVSGKATRHSVRKPWKLTFSITPLSFDAYLQGTPVDIRIDLILPESTVIALHLCRQYCGSIFIKIFVMGSETRTFWSRVHNSLQSSKVADFGTIESA